MTRLRILPIVSILMSVLLFFSACSGPAASSAPSSPQKCQHTFGEWIVKSEPTCISNGSRYHTCTKCKLVETDLTPVGDHVEEVIPGYPATCTSTGVSDGLRCSACRKILKEQFTTEQTGHIGKTTVITPATLYEKEIIHVDCDNCSFVGRIENDTLSPESTGLPVIRIEGDISGISKSSEKSISLTYSDKKTSFSSFGTLKVQGSSSAKYDKKNFTLKLFEDVTHNDKYKVDLGWGKESKYCLKANYIDFSHARNIVGARLFADIVKSRDKMDKNLANAPNYGVIDGYPVLIYINGDFGGLYTLNIPKDNWMFGMKKDESKRQAILMAENWSDFTQLEAELDSEFSGWDLEHCSTENTEWVRTSFNNFIRFLNKNDGASLRAGLGKYVDIEAAIDCLIFTYFLNARDNIAKNCIYVTYDGVKWIPSMYDMDSTWGLHWEGDRFYEPGDLLPTVEADGSISHWLMPNLLWQKLLKNYKSEIKARYSELRKTVLRDEYVEKKFTAFMDQFPEMALKSDRQLWPMMPSWKVDHRLQIVAYTNSQLKCLDEFMGKLK